MPQWRTAGIVSHPRTVGQRRAEAIMGADTERQMLVRFAPDIENVAVWRELAVIAVRRPDEHHHDAARGDALAVVFDVAGDVPGNVRRRWFEAQQLLNGRRNQRPVRDQLTPLVR